jgi:hypothetical protein
MEAQAAQGYRSTAYMESQIAVAVCRVRIWVVLLGVSAMVRGICLNPLPIDWTWDRS